MYTEHSQTLLLESKKTMQAYSIGNTVKSYQNPFFIMLVGQRMEDQYTLIGIQIYTPLNTTI